MTDEGKINEVASKLNSETAYVYGESWCRREEQIRAEIPVADIDIYLKLYQELKKYEYETEEYGELYEKLDEIESLDRWDIASCLKVAEEEDIKRWFEKREFVAMAEESACGIALDLKTARKLLHREIGIWDGDEWVRVEKEAE